MSSKAAPDAIQPSSLVCHSSNDHANRNSAVNGRISERRDYSPTAVWNLLQRRGQVRGCLSNLHVSSLASTDGLRNAFCAAYHDARIRQRLRLGRPAAVEPSSANGQRRAFAPPLNSPFRRVRVISILIKRISSEKISQQALQDQRLDGGSLPPR